ncbi:multiprotein-bridging factor 1 family protein [Salarchaeum sp. JOR-1]|uniref:helix-turn-helix domain-containing protein n=1 Tax=Salarchaeum sp. JOR-1 TaxID=2599399 RepID=UPI001198C473|nr:multiprotein-bridging factor 1 family protein [Salarchaeum sp. JOR-1]QDX41644.1 multiprotein-bridging factor 1 family protein [Salarchaeum sp. JOR-1]
MAKYSTGGSSGGGSSGSCELCGTSSESLTTASVAGAELQVCSNCANLDESSKAEREVSEEQQRRKQAARNTARQFDAATGDSTRWEEEGTNYEGDQLPYLSSDYGRTIQKARQEAGLQLEELADELGVDENDLLAVEQGRANRAGVGGSLIAKLEDRLGVDVTQE